MLSVTGCVVTPVLTCYKWTEDAGALLANQLTRPQVEVDYTDFKTIMRQERPSYFFCVIFMSHSCLKFRVGLNKTFVTMKDDCCRHKLNLCQYPRSFLICSSQIMNPVNDESSE